MEDAQGFLEQRRIERIAKVNRIDLEVGSEILRPLSNAGYIMCSRYQDEDNENGGQDKNAEQVFDEL
jgi:hypothetical protein